MLLLPLIYATIYIWPSYSKQFLYSRGICTYKRPITISPFRFKTKWFSSFFFCVFFFFVCSKLCKRNVFLSILKSVGFYGFCFDVDFPFNHNTGEEQKQKKKKYLFLHSLTNHQIDKDIKWFLSFNHKQKKIKKKTKRKTTSIKKYWWRAEINCCQIHIICIV